MNTQDSNTNLNPTFSHRFATINFDISSTLDFTDAVLMSSSSALSVLHLLQLQYDKDGVGPEVTNDVICSALQNVIDLVKDIAELTSAHHLATRTCDHEITPN